jgi:hypothetical protein
MNDEVYIAFFNSVVLKCPFCDRGQVQLNKMKREGERIYGQPPEVAECAHLVAYGNFEPERCQGGLELFHGVQVLANAPTPQTPEVVQRVFGQSFAFFCRDADRLLELAKRVPAEAPLSIACPFCPKTYPIPPSQDKDEDFCEHAFYWHELGAYWTADALEDEQFNRSCGDNRITGDNVFFSHVGRDGLPQKIAPVLRSAWAFGEENFNVFGFVREPGHVAALNEFLREQLKPYPARAPKPAKAPPAQPAPQPQGKPWWKFW